MNQAERRAAWLRGLESLADQIGAPREAWQLELAAWILTRRPRIEWWARHLVGQNIGIFAGTTASALVDQMEKDGRLDRYGMLPRPHGGPA